MPSATQFDRSVGRNAPLDDARKPARVLHQGRRRPRENMKRATEPPARRSGSESLQLPGTRSTSPAQVAPSAARRDGAAVRHEQLLKLRVLFVTEDDPLYVIRFFDVFLAEYPRDEIEVCGITIDRAFHEPLWKTLRRIHGLYGPWGLVRQGLRFIDARLRRRSIEALAALAALPIVRARSVNEPAYIAQIRQMAPDVIVSVAAPEIFKPELLSVTRLGCINVHSGRLPAYQGMMPTFWQMQRGERAVTITVHRMVPRLDTGDVLATKEFALRNCDSLDRVIKGTKCEGAKLLIRVLRDLRANLRPIIASRPSAPNSAAAG